MTAMHEPFVYIDKETMSVLENNCTMMESINDEIKWLKREYRDLSVSVEAHYKIAKTNEDDLYKSIEVSQLLLTNIYQQRNFESMKAKIARKSMVALQNFRDDPKNKKKLFSSVLSGLHESLKSLSG